MIPMHNRKFATEFFERINNRSLDQVEDVLTEDSRLYFPKTQPVVGKDRIVKFFQILFRQYPELRFEIQHVIAEGDGVAIHLTNRGMNRKHEHYENEGVTLFQFEDGRIVFISDFFKDTSKF
jgi:ketosteroid isomerase-like protein